MEYNIKLPNFNCFFSDNQTYKVFGDGYGKIIYFVKINDLDFSFSINASADLENSQYLARNKHIFKGILLNSKWPWSNIREIKSDEDLKQIIAEANPPLTPREKKENFFLYLFNQQKYEGESLNSRLFSHSDPTSFYFKTGAEMDYYFNSLVDDGLIFKKGSALSEYSFQITFLGLTKAISLNEEGKNSNNCFIAMSFSHEMSETRAVIKQVLQNNKLNPVLVDELTIESEQTINDAIIANIKKSRFCIADFSEQRDGVYFEAGYALGRGLPVLYLCNLKWFKESHFDTNHFPHLLYSNEDELKEKLSNSIQARFL